MRQKQYRQTLTPSVFYILLALCNKERHGYEIMKQAEYDSDGKIEMGPGTLYGSIKRMLADGLIEEAYERPSPESDDERRKYYRLTEFGGKQLSMELNRYKNAIKLAQKRNLLPGMELSNFS
ncbi:MAG: PadR family transcriptional regulator [Actinomycetia bacterium]|nr:PadR family transcriptional regulator [Actinomycetes bacterium]